MTYSSSDQGILRHLSPIHARQPMFYPLPTEEVVIGRDHSCKIVIDSNQYDRVSRRHVAIRPLDPTSTEAKEWIVYDLNSANGTYINGQQLQGGQVLREGDRIVLSEDGPEFIFEYQPHTQSTSSQHPTPAPTPQESTEILQLNKLWIERSPTQLVIYLQDPTKKRIPTREGIPARIGMRTLRRVIVIVLGLVILITPVVNILAIYIFFMLAIGSFVNRVAYAFDLSSGELNIAKQSCTGRLFNQCQFTQYQLSDFTAVRLVKSKYEGDEGTKYDAYNIYLDRISGDSVNIPIPSHDDQQTAQQLVDVIEEYLSQVDANDN